MLKFSGVTVAVVTAALALALPAAAAPPANDDRADAQSITLPANVTGTTAEATRETNEPTERCQSSAGSVWYSYAAPANGRVAIDLQAQGKLDAAVEVF